MKQGACNQKPLLHAIGIVLGIVRGSIKQSDLIERLINASAIGAIQSRGKGQILPA